MLTASRSASGREKIVDENAIFKVLEETVPPNKDRLADILAKARGLEGLDEHEVAQLLLVADEQQTEESLEQLEFTAKLRT